MKVILKQTVPKVGKDGTVVTVADGFARNYLFPRGLAIIADKAQVAALERRNSRLAAKGADEKASAEALQARINGKSVQIAGKVGQGTKLFGAITAEDVRSAIKEQLGEDIERKRIALIEPIKRLGEFQIELDLHREVDAQIVVLVVDPNAPVVAAVEPELVRA